jgi:hypothetical protein
MAMRVIGALLWATSRVVVGSRLCLKVGGVVGVFLGWLVYSCIGFGLTLGLCVSFFSTFLCGNRVLVSFHSFA